MRTTTARLAAPRRPLAVLVAAAGLVVAGCADAGNAPGAVSTAPSPPAVSVTPSAPPQQAAITWAKSMCQTLRPVLGQLGVPPQPDFGNPAATKQAYITYLGNAQIAAQQAIDRLPAVGPPPVENGQQIFDQTRKQLTQLQGNLKGAWEQLKQANSNDSVAIGRAIGAATNVIGLLGALASDPQLRAAIDQIPECQNLTGANTTSGAEQPTGSSEPTP